MLVDRIKTRGHVGGQDRDYDVCWWTGLRLRCILVDRIKSRGHVFGQDRD